MDLFRHSKNAGMETYLLTYERTVGIMQNNKPHKAQ